MLPRFKMDYDVDLERPLEDLGMNIAFTQEADFSGISAASLLVSAVRQRTFMKVDEKGTEAAAATGLVFGTWALEDEPPKPFEMVVDRPFVIIMENRPAGALLFTGIIFDP